MRGLGMRLGVMVGAALLGFGLLVLGAWGSAGAAGGGLRASGLLGRIEAAPPKGQPPAGTSIAADKTAAGFWTQVITYDWSLSKTVSPDALTLPKGAAGTVSYTIAATRTKGGESEVAGVRGAICVTNTGAVTTTGLAITDVVEVQTGGGPFTPFITVPVDVSAKPALGPGESHCYAYEIAFSPIPNAQAYRNHAIVAILNHSGRLGEPWGPEPKAGFSLPEHPTVIEVDASAHVTDEEHCPSGFACAPSETGPWHFSDSGQVVFTKVVTNVAACDVTAVLHNLATLTESDTHESRTAEATVHLTAPLCPVGCVWTQGFWKTHPDVWPSGFHPDAPFFSSGKTWMEALWTPPRGDAYFILAHQYIAAALNRASGASMPAEVKDAFDAATAWFGSHRPGVPAASPDGQEAIRHAEVLAAYNEGQMGVPHCEDVGAGPAKPPKKGGGRPETPPGLEKRPKTPPGLGKRPETPPGAPENRPATPPGQEHRPGTPPGQEKGKKGK